jgi:hypothetical protein
MGKTDEPIPLWVLIQHVLEGTAKLFGEYDVVLSDQLPKDPRSYVVVERSRNGSAAEWMRLCDERDRLKTVAEIQRS